MRSFVAADYTGVVLSYSEVKGLILRVEVSNATRTESCLQPRKTKRGISLLRE